MDKAAEKKSTEAAPSKILEAFLRGLKKLPEQAEPLPRQRLKSYTFGLRYGEKTVNKD